MSIVIPDKDSKYYKSLEDSYNHYIVVNALSGRGGHSSPTHAAEGARMVGYVNELVPSVPLILNSHEWYDGMGYPDGLTGEDIPLGARIIAVADAYDN